MFVLNETHFKFKNKNSKISIKKKKKQKINCNLEKTVMRQNHFVFHEGIKLCLLCSVGGDHRSREGK